MKSVAGLIVLWIGGVVFAVTPATWNQVTEADFAKGEFKSTVVSSHGEIRLAREIKVLMTAEAAPPVVSALAVAGETIYVASGSEGVIHKIEGENVARHAETPGAMVCSLLWTGEDLLVGTGGERAGIHRIDKEGAVKRIWSDPKIKYVWAIVSAPDGVLYAATGPEGTVYEIQGDGQAKDIYKAGKLAKNILCLVRDSKGILYAGTDKSGLVVEIDPSKKSSRILLDADEKEIAALVLDGSGGLCAATSDSAKVSSDGDSRRSNEKAGRVAKPVTTRPVPRPGTQPATNPSKSSKLPEASSRPAAPIPADIARKIATARSTPPRPSAPRPTPSKKGNAVYYIGADGLVRTLFRRPVAILAMVLESGKLVLGTGNGGGIYSVTLDGDETVQIADTDAKQVTSLAVAPDTGALVFSTANKGSVGMLAPGLATEGTFTSVALDAKQIARWGTLRLGASVPPKTRLTVSTRSGNVAKPEEGTWSDWSEEIPAGREFLRILSPSGRFLQYRLKLGDGGNLTAIVGEVRIIYQVGNLQPVVAGVKVQASPKAGERSGQTGGPKTHRQVQISASDPNKDKLTFQIEFREIGSEKWIQIAEKLTKPQYVWNTQTVGDGVYELRITASDSPSNPPESALTAARISEPIVVDNSPPMVRRIAAKSDDGGASVEGLAVDTASRIVAIHYAVDSQDEWTAVLPDDGICDAGEERFSFQVKDLKPGVHRIAVKVEDLYGNAGYAVVTVSVGK